LRLLRCQLCLEFRILHQEVLLMSFQQIQPGQNSFNGRNGTHKHGVVIGDARRCRPKDTSLPTQAQTTALSEGDVADHSMATTEAARE
ncbi:hypothetical protein BaRGS_00019567, partial [Batillaria attramentaria]